MPQSANNPSIGMLKKLAAGDKLTEGSLSSGSYSRG